MTSRFRYLALLAAVVLISLTLMAQLENGMITGTVKDPSGAVVPKAQVTVTSVTRGFSRTATSGPNGTYTITNLPPGPYDVAVTAPGFGKFNTRAQATVGGTTTLDVPLQLQSSGTTVEVVGEGGTTVNVENQQLSTVVTSREITGLPTITRNPYDLVQTSGNVSQGDLQNYGGFVRGAGVNINGQRAASTDVLLDGGENVNLFDSTVAQTVPLDSVQELRVITSDFTADYGRASGGIVNVATKSGTNNFHGSVYEFNRISALASNTYDNVANGVEKGRFTRNQFGYAVGGPILHDKLFFFSSTEGLRVRSSAKQINLIPTAGLIAASAPATQAIFSSFGKLVPGAVLGSTVSAGGVANAFQQVTYNVADDAGGGRPQNSWYDVQRIDLNISDKTTLFGRYALQHEDWFPGTESFSPYDGFNTGQTTRYHNFMLSVNHIFTPSVITSTKLLYNRLNLLQPINSQIVPTYFMFQSVPASIAGHRIALPGYLPFNPGSGIPFGGPQNVGEIYQDLTWTRGSHQFKFGGQFVYTQDNRVFGAYEEAAQAFAQNGQLSQAMTNFLSGNLYNFQAAIFPQGKFPCPVSPTTLRPVVSPSCSITLPVDQPNFSRSNRYKDAAAYVQDSWKLFPTFTLNLGVRWEYYGVQHSKRAEDDSNFYFGSGDTLADKIRNGFVATVPNSPIDPQGLWEPDYNNFAPRIGFAWDLLGNGTTSLRGGYGIAYERNFGNVTFNVIQNPPNYAVISLIGGRDVPVLPVSASNFGPVAGATGTVPLPRTSLRAVRQDIGTAYSQMWSLGLERQLATNTVLSLDYSGSRGLHLYTIEDPNRLGSGVIYGGDVMPAALAVNDRLNRQYTNVNMRGKGGFSYYNALNVGFRTSNLAKSGLQMQVNYTWAHAIDNLSSTFSESFNNFNLGLLDPYNPSLDKGNADFDVRHRVVISGLWDIPAFRQQNGFMGHLLGGWQFSPIFEAHTGYPFSVWDCTNGAQVCPRWDPGTSSIPLSVTSSPTAIAGEPNSFSLLSLPNAAATAGNPADLNPLLGISDIGPSCTTPGSGRSGPCLFPATMTGRNAFRGPNWWNFTAAVYKNIKITERVGLQLRGEAFNIFNHHNFYVNGSTVDVSQLDYVQGKKGGLGVRPELEERRHLQLAVKINF